MSDEATRAANKIKEENEKTGRLAGAGAGALAGAQVGTVVLPIPVVGTFTGALVGGLVGTKIGKKVGGALLDKVGGSMETGGHKADIGRELERLARLRESGAIDDAEFKALKAKLLGL